jgi:hypothetical protein
LLGGVKALKARPRAEPSARARNTNTNEGKVLEPAVLYFPFACIVSRLREAVQ